MKRICAIMVALLMLGMTFPLTETKPNPVGVATREDLMRIADNPGGSYVLTADIDMQGDPWTPIPFSGVFDGAGHTIGNLSVIETSEQTAVTTDGNRLDYDSVFAGLFSIAIDAEIKNLRLLNTKITIETDRCCFIGAIAGYAENTTVSDCTVSMRGSLTVSSKDAGVGGMIGYLKTGEVKDCAVEAELEFVDVNESIMCEEFLGGVYACGYGEICRCSVFTRGYANIYGYAHNGGVVGMFKLPRKYNGKFLAVRESVIDAEIRFFEVTDSRRAYCEPLIGENCANDCYLTHNEIKHFDFTYHDTAIPKHPEPCENPSYTAEVTLPACTEWGYTTYTCTTCGYSYRDDYTLPAHRYRQEGESATCTQEGHAYYTCELCGDSYSAVIPAKGHTPGEWTVAKEPGPDTTGEEILTCTECGEVLDSRVIPAAGTPEPNPTPLIVYEAPKSISVEESIVEVYVGDYYTLHVTVDPEEAAENLRFVSSDPSIVKVGYDGVIKGLYPGTAEIRICSSDGGVEATCSVIVSAVPQKEQETHSLFSWLRCG